MAQYRQIRFVVSGWRARFGLIVAVALGVAVAAALIVVSLGLILVLIPVVAIGVLIGAWRLRQLQAAARAARPADDGERTTPRTIETEYTVIEDRQDRPR